MIETLEIDHPKCKATVALQGAQLISWQPVGEDKSILWCTDKVFWTPGKPIRGGVPLCWPWFGKAKQPSHGFARLLNWSLVERQNQIDAVHLLFELKDNLITRELWPWPFLARVRMVLGKTCLVEFEVDCQQDSTGALHTYLQVSDVDGVNIAGLGKDYQDALEHNERKTGNSVLRVDKALDRIYTSPDKSTTLNDPFCKREIRQLHQGHSDIVVWTPWEKGTSNLTDVNADDYRQFICVETAAINQPLVSPMSVTISC